MARITAKEIRNRWLRMKVCERICDVLLMRELDE